MCPPSFLMTGVHKTRPLKRTEAGQVVEGVKKKKNSSAEMLKLQGGGGGGCLMMED